MKPGGQLVNYAPLLLLPPELLRQNVLHTYYNIKDTDTEKNCAGPEHRHNLARSARGQEAEDDTACNESARPTRLRERKPSQPRGGIPAGEVANIAEDQETKVVQTAGEAKEAADPVKYVDILVGAETAARHMLENEAQVGGGQQHEVAEQKWLPAKLVGEGTGEEYHQGGEAGLQGGQVADERAGGLLDSCSARFGLVGCQDPFNGFVVEILFCHNAEIRHVILFKCVYV